MQERTVVFHACEEGPARDLVRTDPNRTPIPHGMDTAGANKAGTVTGPSVVMANHVLCASDGEAPVAEDTGRSICPLVCSSREQ